VPETQAVLAAPRSMIAVSSVIAIPALSLTSAHVTVSELSKTCIIKNTLSFETFHPFAKFCSCSYSYRRTEVSFHEFPSIGFQTFVFALKVKKGKVVPVLN
jgi:hypothetical protein